MAPVNIPIHIGIIMDGNGRWAKARGLPRTEGHREGLNAAKRIVAAAEDSGVRFVSLYTFSTENWKRAADEVGFLMGLIASHLSSELDFYRERRIRVLHSGNPEGLPPEIRAELESVARDTAGFDRMTVNLAINYGGRDEIIRAASRAAAAAAREAAVHGAKPAPVSEKDIAAHLDRPELPDPDLIIRTGGELRLSNFLLWQSAYSELFFSERLWPDFSAEDLAAAMASYSLRQRRFGGAK